MNRLKEAVVKMVQAIARAVLRFPLTVLCLICATALTCYMISLHKTPELFIQKLMFTFLMGSFIGVSAQFACERFPRLAKIRWGVYVLSALLTLGYYFIISPAPAIDYGVGARTSVAVFSMFCAFIWLPSYGGKFNFNSVALVHFKSFFTSVLFSGVLALGLTAILQAVNILLFRINSDWFGYTHAVVWILFATTYYLALLPLFNSEEEADRLYTEQANHYPRVLEILVSYILIPLITAYTLVLFAYFVKIGITRNWPSGQLGPMILAYSAIGLIVYVLASRLENRFAVLYQRLFPKVLIPVVIMQLISVYIRLNAYGFTESRYYVALFGVFSIVAGIVLSLRPVARNGLIALLAAGFAIVSVIPPVDAFTVSRHSQITRLESMLGNAGVLIEGKIVPRSDADMTLRLETTSILNYLEYRRYLGSLAWLPKDFQTNRDMQKTLGFEPAYEMMGGMQNFFANLNMEKPMDINGYDVMLQVEAFRGMEQKKSTVYDFKVRDASYQLRLERLTPREVRVSVATAGGEELVSTGLYDFATSIKGVSNRPKDALDASELTLDAAGNGCKMRIIFQNVNVVYGSGADAGADYMMFILIGVPR
ncbi:MAG: DUF4153 domain-containing protein [Syntrophomonadaceae bacterium]